MPAFPRRVHNAFLSSSGCSTLLHGKSVSPACLSNHSASPCSTFLADLDGRVVSLSEQASCVGSYSPSTALSRDFSLVFHTLLLLCCQTRPTFLAPHRTEVVHCMRKLPLPIVKLTRVPSSRLRPEGQDDEGTVHGICGSSRFSATIRLTCKCKRSPVDMTAP